MKFFVVLSALLAVAVAKPGVLTVGPTLLSAAPAASIISPYHALNSLTYARTAPIYTSGLHYTYGAAPLAAIHAPLIIDTPAAAVARGDHLVAVKDALQQVKDANQQIADEHRRILDAHIN